MRTKILDLAGWYVEHPRRLAVHFLIALLLFNLAITVATCHAVHS